MNTTLKAKAEQAIQRAQNLGSSAATLRGALKFLRTQPSLNSVLNTIDTRLTPLANGYPRPNPEPHSGQMTRKYKYQDAEKSRKADPDAKRARHDKNFRIQYLRRLRAEETKLRNPPVRTLAEITKATDSRSTRNIRINEIARLRTIALGKVSTAKEVDKIQAGVLVRIDAALARRAGASIDMRGNDATLNSTRKTSHGTHSAGETTWKNGKPVSYTRATHDNYVRSFALIHPDHQTLNYALHNTEYRVRLPDGYIWTHTGASGSLMASFGPDSYHPTAAELIDKRASEKIPAAIHERAATRKATAAAALAEQAELEGVYVCLMDSVRGGNCLAGSQSFAARHNLDTHRHYSAPELLHIANGETSRVRIAIKAATARTRIENERGYAVLAEHGIDLTK